MAYGQGAYGAGTYGLGGTGEAVQAPEVTLALRGVGTLSDDYEPPTGPPDLVVSILDDTVDRAPSALTVVLAGGAPNTPATISIDTVEITTVMLGDSGTLGSTSVPLSAALGAAGVHTLNVVQTLPDATTTTGYATFTVAEDPVPYPAAVAAAAPAVDVPEATVPGTPVRKWVLQDAMPGGLGSYVLPVNPKTMTSPHYEKALTARRSTAAVGGRFHVSEGAGVAKSWSFSGYAPTEAMIRKLIAFGRLNRRFYVIDHRGRAWQVVFNNVSAPLRLRQNVNGVETDWGSDYTVTATILSQDWSTPA